MKALLHLSRQSNVIKSNLAARRLLSTQMLDGDRKTAISLARMFAARIRSTGAMPVAEFMRESLLHPTLGYYSNKDSFVGALGKQSSDFVTSPEISSIFGELLAIWIVHQISVQRQELLIDQDAINLMEFGPGTGTMMSDILTTFTKLANSNPQTKANWNVHLVEASRRLTQVQRDKLSVADIAKEFPSIKWHDYAETAFRSLEGPSVFLAHEFLDALPIHKFQRIDGKGFREVLIDLDTGSNEKNDQSDPKFRYVLARGPTPASITFPPKPEDTRKHVEVCPAAVRFVDRVARYIAAKRCGLALIADYGHVGDGEDTFRAYSKSTQKEPLSVEPGSADLTADVDFAYLAATAGKVDGVQVVGPITQRAFLTNMGFLHRLEVLMRACRDRGDVEGRRRLYGQAEMLLLDKHMGSRFKFMAIIPESSKVQRIAGFTPLT